jgi:hypothetical protein
MAIKDRECIFAHQHPCAIVSEIRVCANIILVLDFNDISHDVPGRSTKNIDPTADGVVGINLTSASYKYQWSQVHTASQSRATIHTCPK